MLTISQHHYVTILQESKSRRLVSGQLFHSSAAAANVIICAVFEYETVFEMSAAGPTGLHG